MIWKKYQDEKPKDKESIIYCVLVPVKMGMIKSSILTKYYGIYNSSLEEINLLDNSPWKSDNTNNIITCVDDATWCDLEEYLIIMKQIKKEKQNKAKKLKKKISSL